MAKAKWALMKTCNLKKLRTYTPKNALASGQVGSIFGVNVYVDEANDMDTCRNCGHFKFLHEVSEVHSATHSYSSSQACDPQQDHACNCTEYVPEDILEYCLWRAKKRGLIK